MSQVEKSQKMKQQVELLKQKYLKKNQSKGSLKTSSDHNKQVSQSKIINGSQSKSPAALGDLQQTKKPEMPSVNKQPEKLQQKRNEKKQWSLRNMMDQQPHQIEITSKSQQKEQFYDQVELEKDPFQLRKGEAWKLINYEGAAQADPQFDQMIEEGQQERKKQKQNEKKPAKVIDLEEACRLWKKSTFKALEYLLFDQNQLGEKNSNLCIESKNPLFPGILQKIAHEFLFKNPYVMTDSQKDVVFEMAIDYFSPSPEIISDVLLLCMVKIGSRCLAIYSDEILSKIQYYFQRILLFQKYLLNEQLDFFVQFMNQRIETLRRNGYDVPVKWYLWLLLLKPSNTFTHQVLITKQLTNPTDLFVIFCILEPNNTGVSLSLLYLKSLDGLAPIFSQYKILESVIEKFNKVKVPQPLYKPVKALKLKLIRSADNKGMAKKPSEEEKGFMSFFNQKMGILKGKLDNSVINKAKTEVYYDEALGEYKERRNSFTSRN